jgi:hypothetical protein
LAVVCNPVQAPTQQQLDEGEDGEWYKSEQRPCILFMDSLVGGAHKNEVAKKLRNYLEKEWEKKHPDDERVFDRDAFPVLDPKVGATMSGGALTIGLLTASLH